jgi:hypothetical protein
MKPSALFVLLILLCHCVPGWAGMLVLDNGDQLTGELKAIEGPDLVWKSDTLGEIRVSKARVTDLKTSVPLKIRGQDQSCHLYEMLGRKLRFRCGGKRKRYSLMGLTHVVPYDDHASLNYAYGGKLRVTGWKQAGNTDTEYLEVLSEVRLRHGDLRHDLQLTHNSQSSITTDATNGTSFKTYNRRSLASYSLSWFFVPRWFWANTGSAERDDNRNIGEEYRLASGIGHSLWESGESVLDLEMGLQYNRTYLAVNPPEQQPDSYPALRLATNFRYRLKSAAQLYNKNQYNHSLEGPDPGESERWEFRTDTGINLPIGFGISANISMEWVYINHARDQNPNASREDTTYRMGVNYSW